MRTSDKIFSSLSVGLEQMPGIAGIKDTNHLCITCNSKMARLFSFGEKKNVRGLDSKYLIKKDILESTKKYSSLRHPLNNYANSIAEQDEKVFRGYPQSVLDAHYYVDGLHIFLSQRMPIYNGDKIIGLLFHALELSPMRENIDAILSTKDLDITEMSKSNLLEHFSYSVNRYGLSEREYECMTMIAKGYTAKKIAQFLGLSFRTVEYYTGHIKEKLECRTKNQLVEKFLTLRSKPCKN